MAFQLIKRTDRLEAAGRPFITLSPTVFRYGATLIREARLDRRSRVSVLVDPDTFRLGFEFHHDAARRESYRLTWSALADGKRRACGVNSALGTITGRFGWVRHVAHRPKSVDRRFDAVFDGRLWIIRIGPTFECVADRSGKDILTDAQGIYRYVKSDTGEVIYIGRGNIRHRLVESGRGAWDFDRIEYSLVPDADEQAHWERHWIEDHRRRHDRLPERNRV